MSHLESTLRALLDLFNLLGSPFGVSLYAVCPEQIYTLLAAAEVHGQQGDKLVQENVPVREVPNEHGLLQRIKHHLLWNDELADNLCINA